MAEAVVARHERKEAEVTRLWRHGAGHTGEPSAWYAYNGVVEAIDHNGELFPTRGGVYRTASLLDGTLRDLKAQVFDNLLTFADAQ